MKIMICDKCHNGGFLIERGEETEKHKDFIHPETHDTVQLCKSCEKELKQKQEELRQKHLEEALKLNEDFWLK